MAKYLWLSVRVVLLKSNSSFKCKEKRWSYTCQKFLNVNQLHNSKPFILLRFTPNWLREGRDEGGRVALITRWLTQSADYYWKPFCSDSTIEQASQRAEHIGFITRCDCKPNDEMFSLPWSKRLLAKVTWIQPNPSTDLNNFMRTKNGYF